jgi:hypothetical protein
MRQLLKKIDANKGFGGKDYGKTAWKSVRANEWLKLKWIFKYIGWEDVDWIYLSQGRNQ